VEFPRFQEEHRPEDISRYKIVSLLTTKYVTECGSSSVWSILGQARPRPLDLHAHSEPASGSEHDSNCQSRYKEQPPALSVSLPPLPSPPLHEYKPNTSRMTDFDASPQFTVVKKWFDAFATLDTRNVEPLVSKDYQYQVLPESMGLPTEEREEHFQRVREMFPLFKKFEVRTRHRGQINRLRARRLIPTAARSLTAK